MVWYSHLLKNFLQFVVAHTVKVFVVHEAKVDVFLEFSCIFYDPMDVENLISGALPFLNPVCTSRILYSHTFGAYIEEYQALP